MTKHQRDQRLANFPYSVDMNETHVRAEHIEWLKLAFPDGYTSRWTFGGPHVLYFTSEQDKMLFVLRWA